MTQEELIQKLKEALEKQPVRLAYLYGSYATGKTHIKSDIDIAVVPERGVRMFGFEIAADVHDALGGGPELDIRSIDLEKPPIFLRNVLKSRKLIFARDEKERVNFEVQAMKKFYDTTHLRDFMTRHMYKTIKEGSYGHRQSYNR